MNVKLVSRRGGLGARRTCVSGSEMTGGAVYWGDQEVQVSCRRGRGVWRPAGTYLSMCVSVQEACGEREDPGQLLDGLHVYGQTLQGSTVSVGLSISSGREAQALRTHMSQCQQLGSEVATGYLECLSQLLERSTLYVHF